MSVALVVGGASGIGRACAEHLSASGPVAVADLRPAPEHAPCTFELDARDAGAVEDAFDRAEAALGPIDRVVYAAGTARITPLLEIPAKEWELVLGVNLTGAFNVLGAAARRMRVRRGGAFVAVSSIDAVSPVAGLAHYCAAKAGLESLVRVAALELAPDGIRVNAVSPGVIDTPLMHGLLERVDIREDFLAHIPLGRIGDPADVAAAVGYLLSDAASYVTGQTLVVDGGMSLREHARLLREDG